MFSFDYTRNIQESGYAEPYVSDLGQICKVKFFVRVDFKIPIIVAS